MFLYGCDLNFYVVLRFWTTIMFSGISTILVLPILSTLGNFHSLILLVIETWTCTCTEFPLTSMTISVSQLFSFDLLCSLINLRYNLKLITECCLRTSSTLSVGSFMNIESSMCIVGSILCFMMIVIRVSWYLFHLFLLSWHSCMFSDVSISFSQHTQMLFAVIV